MGCERDELSMDLKHDSESAYISPFMHSTYMSTYTYICIYILKITTYLRSSDGSAHMWTAMHYTSLSGWMLVGSIPHVDGACTWLPVFWYCCVCLYVLLCMFVCIVVYVCMYCCVYLYGYCACQFSVNKEIFIYLFTYVSNKFLHFSRYIINLINYKRMIFWIQNESIK